jgi:succinate dehydrogenase/fumarate reductase flavoprotein subunit
MSVNKCADKVIETDVLVMGGGIAGCCVAAKARDHGLDVTIAEKAHTARSGSAAQGIDHVGPIPPEGVTPLDMVKAKMDFESELQGEGRFWDPNIIYKLTENTNWAMDYLQEELELPMKWHWGKLYGVPMYWFNGLRTEHRVHWQNVKPILSKSVRKKGVNVLERVMIVDLLTNNGRIVGATAVDTRTGEFIVIKAKATVVATGAFARCYEPETPLIYKYKFRFHWCPASVSGDGWAAAYRAGAELTNMDLTGWHFRNRDDITISFGNFGINEGIPANYLTWDGEQLITKHPASYYAELEKQGKTPLYRSLERLPDDWFKRIEVAFVDERMVSFKMAEDRGFNPKHHRYEFMLNKPHNFMTPCGVNVDEDFKATVNGLFAAGDCASALHGCGGATVSGLLAGDSVYKYVNGLKQSSIDEAQVESQREKALAPLNVTNGTEPMELECAIRHVCERYIGQFKSEGKMREGQRRLGSLKREFLPKLMAKNPHYLMRSLEVRNIMDLAEAHINAALERKETRGNHIRLDYPQLDANRTNKIAYQCMKDGKLQLEIREAPNLKPEYLKGGK